MDRKRTVLAASWISVSLVVGSGAFAFATGAFTSRPADRVGSFETIRAELALQNKPSTTAGRTTTSRSRRSSTTGEVLPLEVPGSSTSSPRAVEGEPLGLGPTGPTGGPAATLPEDHSTLPEVEHSTAAPTARVSSSASTTAHDDSHESEPPDDHPDD